MNSEYKKKRHSRFRNAGAPRFLKGLLFLIFIQIPGCNSLENDYRRIVTQEFLQQPVLPEEILIKSDIDHLPVTVQKYLIYTGAIGKSKLQNMRFEFEAQMWKKPGERPIASHSVQYNFFAKPARFFFMKASMFWIPARIFHNYSDRKATMKVRIASIFDIVDISGPELSSTETVTILNDMCVFAPSTLIDKRLTWTEIDSSTTKVTFENGPHRISALLYFNDKNELIDFVSDDRSALKDDGTLKKIRWSTPVRDYRNFAGRKIPTYGEATYHYPEGNFIYGKFNLKNIGYNLENPEKY